MAETILSKSCLKPFTLSYKAVMDLLWASAVSNSLVVIVSLVTLLKLYRLIQKYASKTKKFATVTYISAKSI